MSENELEPMHFFMMFGAALTAAIMTAIIVVTLVEAIKFLWRRSAWRRRWK